MKWTQALKPKKWKVIVSLVPFIFPLNQLLVALNLYFNVLPIEVDLILDYPFYFIRYIEIIVSQPLASILGYFDWWSRNSLVVAPDGPLLPGSFAVAITYSLLIYITWSLVSLRKSKQM